MPVKSWVTALSAIAALDMSGGESPLGTSLIWSSADILGKEMNVGGRVYKSHIHRGGSVFAERGEYTASEGLICQNGHVYDDHMYLSFAVQLVG